MWSEHCSYKSSRVHLKTLPTEGPRVLQGPGENAGAVDIGDGLAAVFKIESHNHPSFIEPYQGAATGVGGIIRDIFTMGARPIALLDSLRFGPLDDARNRRILQGVVAGIGGYGNSIGIPTVGGEVMFDESYSGNPLVNVFCLGIAQHDAHRQGRGRAASAIPIYYVGAKTGPRRHPRRDDGVGGVRREVGGEAPGRAGGRSVHGEAAARGVPRGDGDRRVRRRAGHGRRGPDVRDVARRDRAAASASRSTSRRCRSARPGMTPYEIMLSESQERMLLIVKRGREAEVERIFEKWDLHAVRIGEVTATASAAHQAPRRGRRRRAESRADRRGAGLSAAVPARRRAATELQTIPRDAIAAARRGRPTRCWRCSARRRSRASAGFIGSTTTWCARTRSRPAGASAGVVRVKGTTRALAMSVDGNGRFVPARSAAGRAAGAWPRPRATSRAPAALPIGATNCLNFGNPERPEIMWQFAEAVAGHRRGVPRARHSDHRRQRQPLQRDRRPARFCRRRSSASSA